MRTLLIVIAFVVACGIWYWALPEGDLEEHSVTVRFSGKEGLDANGKAIPPRKLAFSFIPEATRVAAKSVLLPNSNLKGMPRLDGPNAALQDCREDNVRAAIQSQRYEVIGCKDPDGKLAMFIDDKHGIRWITKAGVVRITRK